jgi:flagellar hook-associated protein 1 FlgK
MVTNQEALVNQLSTRKESVSGVSIDEEMTNLMQYQRSYQAAAKMVNVVDDLMNVIVNGLIR